MASYAIRKKGVLNLPGITNATKSLTEKLLLQDAEKHHCYFRAPGLHNHLSHQVLAAYDMGASIGVVQKIYDMNASSQRPIYLEEKDADIVVTRDNWTEHLGNQNAYGAYFKFFRQEIEKLGASATLESYVFQPEANDKGKNMLDRFLSGALHPFIQVGYGAEFADDTLVATGLAQTAIHKASLAEHFPYSVAWGSDNAPPPPPSTGPGRQPSAGISLLEVLRQVCDSNILTPPLPYRDELLLSDRIKGAVEGKKAAEILRLSQQFTSAIPNDASQQELDARVEELIWVVTLLMFATGREGRETRLDFFLMHLVTSSLFFEPVFSMLKNSRSKVALIRHYVPYLIVLTLSRGRPVIRANLTQDWTETPRPAGWDKILGIDKSKGAGVGDMTKDEDYNPWPVLVQGAIHHPDLHLAKAMRTLIFAGQRFGTTGRGEVIGAFRPGKTEREETFKGVSQLDGSLFVRAAGVMMDYMGWSVSGKIAKVNFWDRSALGWDDAWASKN
ncbi:Oxidoreductase AflY [Leucoagaricus sp. SymC.cos]|nr:Oxidoreductase AflY [Leucoagaricus sp. SymC.cos]